MAPLNVWLADTGPLVAYLNARDPAHAEVVKAIDEYPGQLVSSGAVLTEAMAFMPRVRNGPAALADLVADTEMKVFDVCQPNDLREAANLMSRYSDTPMDFADATLVLLANALDVGDILTLDRRGFSTYRREGRRGFNLVLDY